MLVLIKSGAWIAEINDPFIAFIEILDEVWRRWGDTPVITSGADGKHKETSLHYKGMAWDVRIWGLHDPVSMADELRSRLNADGHKYDVLFGDREHRDHIHVEYQPKGGKVQWELRPSLL